MKYSTHTIQGVTIELRCDRRLHSRISHYLDFYYEGERRRPIKPLQYEVSIVNDPPPIPPGAVRAVKAMDISCYKNGPDIFYTSVDGSLVHLNPATRKVMGYLREEAVYDTVRLYSLVAAPFSEMLKYSALYSLHSAGLYRDGVGYMFSGNSGSGKTTTTLSLVCEGFKYVSDDILLLEEVESGIIAHSMAKTFNVDRDLAKRFPLLVEDKYFPPESGSKVSVDIDEVVPDSFVPHVRPDVAIFLKIVTEKKSMIHPLDQAGVFNRLLQQTALAADREVSQKQILTMGKLVRQVRGFELSSGRDVYEDPGILLHLIREIKQQNAGN